jgi:hypothetical protein
VTLRGEHRLRVFENRVLWKIFGLKKDELTEGCRKVHDKELHEFGWACSMNGGEENHV